MNRGFNLRAFESGKTFSAIPAIFQEHVQFIEDLFKIRKYPHIHISNNIKPPSIKRMSCCCHTSP